MKTSMLLFYVGMVFVANAQTLQLHYDPRHSLDPAKNNRNYTSIFFEYFKNQDSGTAFIKPGSILLKTQADMFGEKNNIGQIYMQVSQTFRCWKPKIFINLQFSGGLGITEPGQYSYYIPNTYSVGFSYPFKWVNAYLSAVINYKVVSFSRPSSDPIFTLYWWKGVYHYKLELLGDFSAWTENNNHGDIITKNLDGKRFFFFAEPQLWYNLNKIVALGSRLNAYYHILAPTNTFNVYPSLGIKIKI